MSTQSPLNAEIDRSAQAWKRASQCGPDGGNCVEYTVFAVGRTIAVRRSADRPTPTLVFGALAWRDFLISIVPH